MKTFALAATVAAFCIQPVAALAGTTEDQMNAIVAQYHASADAGKWINPWMAQASADAVQVAQSEQSRPSADDTGSRSFNANTAELGQRLRLQGDAQQEPITAENSSANFDRYVADVNRQIYASAHSDTTAVGTEMAMSSKQSTATFGAYLSYLAQRLNADAGKPGPVMGLDTGSARFDRYVEELNYRLQTLQQASDSTGF